MLGWGGRIELRNVVAKYSFERSHRFPRIKPNSRHRDYSRLSCVEAEHAVSHRHDPLHPPPLLEPEIHVHLAVHRHRCGKILAGVLRLAGTAVESA